ncbi:MAG: dihydropteroate synthase [Muribaculaceae bacterium]|nr:dihydropteroate synthase [Muribaculaceae bacterium]
MFTLNLHGRLAEYDRPAVMGIINATPDSFYDRSRVADESGFAVRAERMAADGADFIDVGAFSTRPGALPVSIDDEVERLRLAIPAVRRGAPGIPVSVDTFRAEVARVAVEELGADIVNDVSGGNLDPMMFDTVAELGVPYILGHMRGEVGNMMEFTQYEDVTADVLSELGDRLQQLALLGVNDVIIDPCFGFSKTLDQNYELLANLKLFELFHRPLLVGVSRKSMITRVLDIDPADALYGTIVINTLALERGASVLRVHDVIPAVQAVKIYEKFKSVQTGL